jgi:hypothetical protein
MNDHSSRSHAILTFVCSRTDRPTAALGSLVAGPGILRRAASSSGSSGFGSGGRPSQAAHPTTPKGHRLRVFPESPEWREGPSDALSIASHDSDLSSVTDGSAGRPRHGAGALRSSGVGGGSGLGNGGLFGDGNGGDCGDSGAGVVVVSRLQLVDLAGSERVAKSEVVGERLKEAQAINKSLACLGDVIGALSRNMCQPGAGAHGGHVPFRDSKLTYFLKGSLGGAARVAMLCNASPAAVHADETLCSLKFAARCRDVALKTANGLGGGGIGTRRDSFRHSSAAAGVRSRSTSVGSRGNEVLRSPRG